MLFPHKLCGNNDNLRFNLSKKKPVTFVTGFFMSKTKCFCFNSIKSKFITKFTWETSALTRRLRANHQAQGMGKSLPFLWPFQLSQLQLS